MDPNKDALKIFTNINDFLHGSGDRRSPALETFPKSFGSIPCRRVYKPLEAQISSSNYLTMDRWEPSELSFGGAGTFWCFTELPRIGENISRRTEDGQSWLSKTGRVPKNGFPPQILVDKLAISGKGFHMVELTLEDQKKPTVALCKIWRKQNNAAASLQTTVASMSNVGASTSQLIDDLSITGEMEMEMDQPQEGSIGSTRQDIDDAYQKAISSLFNIKSVFTFVVELNEDDAKKIALAVQYAASTMSNVLGINPDDCAPWVQPSSSNVAQNHEFFAEDSYFFVDDE